ncbi:MAG: AAA family ATPase [Planctomycetota bacterium]
MTIAEYLKERAEALTENAGRIKDPRVFNFNFMPDQPMMREEAKPIIDACLRYLSTDIPANLYIYGSRGTGKTLMVRYIGRLLEKHHNAKVVYANCRKTNTSFKILADLLGVRPRGYSLDELWKKFTASHTERIIMILDECDLLSDKDVNRDLLYLVSRSPRNYMAILLSNQPQFFSTLDESVRSTLQPELVHFRNYNAVEIAEILKDRAILGLGSVPEDVISEIAALTVRVTNSDARVAIKTLYDVALNESHDVNAVFERASRDLVTDIVTNLDDRNLLILKSAASVPEPFVKAIYERYRKISIEESEEPFSYSYFLSNLSYLQSLGLIALVSTKVGRTYTNRIQRLFDPSVIEAAWKIRFPDQWKTG